MDTDLLLLPPIEKFKNKIIRFSIILNIKL